MKQHAELRVKDYLFLYSFNQNYNKLRKFSLTLNSTLTCMKIVFSDFQTVT